MGGTVYRLDIRVKPRQAHVASRNDGSDAEELVLTPAGLEEHRRQYLAAIRAYHAEGKAARTWPIPFLIRRTAHHVMDHAWEMEDRDLGE